MFALGLSRFESTDGNLVVDGTDSESDWGTPNLPNLVVAPDKPSGGNDDSFKRAKEDDPNPVIDVGSIPKNKSDLLRFYVANEQVEVEDSVFQDFLYLGWARFNQSTVLSANGVTPKRTSRDI